MRRLVGEIRSRTGLTCSVGIGPNKLVAKVASDAEKPAGFRRAHAASRPASDSPTPRRAWCPGSGRGPQSALAALGITTLAALAQAPEETLVERFGSNQGAALGRRARFEHDGAVSEERKVVSESRERTFDRDISYAGRPPGSA